MIHERRTGRVQHQGFTPIIVMKEQRRRNTLSNCQLESTEHNITQNTVKLSNQHIQLLLIQVFTQNQLHNQWIESAADGFCNNLSSSSGNDSPSLH